MSFPKFAKPGFATSSDRYQIVSQIGSGGAGVVYKVRNSKGNCVALKYMTPRKYSIEKSKRLKNEMYFCGKVKHKNILRIIDSGNAFCPGHDQM